MSIKNVFLDLDDTLLDFHKGENTAICKTLARFGAEPTEEVVALYRKINRSCWQAVEREEMNRDDILTLRFKLVFEKLGVKADEREIQYFYERRLAEECHFIDGARELLSSLYGKLKMYIVTNGMACVQNSRYKLAGLDKVFDGMFISEEVGANKPDARFFEYVSEHIEGFQKERTLIIGDSQTSDIAGGNAFGIDTCWYSPNNAAAKYEPTYTVDSLKKVLPIALAEVDDE